ncbi:hypothetical protein Bbelb_010360 [Branchiostoma belcheri]|nr:hypothetical protein Bbelb_010360 [Branchiostoma belcheri]
MTPGLSNDLQEISDTRKTAVINNELLRLNVDIATLQETRLADSGTLRESDYTFIWQGKSSQETREHGVGFAIKNSLLNSIEPRENGTERILTLRLHTENGPLNLVSVYAPTLYSQEEIKDEFYCQLQSTIQDIPKQEKLLLLGDFNARVGADHDSWPNCLGKFGVGNINDNGQRLLEFCTVNGLCITNSFFNTKPQHKVSWRHPRSKHWHQLDLVIVRRCHLKDVLLTRSYHSADCDTDHSLVCCTVRLRLKKIHRAKPPGKIRIDASKTRILAKAHQFAEALEDSLLAKPAVGSAEQKWGYLRDTLHRTALSVFGRKQGKTQDWFEAYANDLNVVIEEKRTALLEHKRSPSQQTLQALRTARSKVQCMARQCANKFWLDLCQSIQSAAESGNIRGMYEGIKKAVGPTTNKSAPLKCLSGETITDREKQMERWLEHYSELYSRENTINESALDSIDTLSVLWDLDAAPTLEEVSKAIDSLRSGKAPGMDGIPPEVIKSAKGVLLPELHDLLCQCWEEGEIPQDMKDSNIITLYKNKGDRSDCNNYRGISLLSIVGKIKETRQGSGISITSSIIMLTVIAIDRFYAIIFPLKARITETNTAAVISTVWLISCAVNVPLLVVSEQRQWQWDDGVLEIWCAEKWDQHQKAVYTSVLFVVLYAVPLVVMMVAYFLLARKLWRTTSPGIAALSIQQLQLKAKKKARYTASHTMFYIIHPDGGLANPVCISKNLGEEIGAAKIRSLQKHRGKSSNMQLAVMMPLQAFTVIKMLVVVMTVFFVCWTPYQVLQIWLQFGNLPEESPPYFKQLRFVVLLLGYSNSALNPIIYAGVNENFRKSFRDAYKCKQCRRNQVQPDGPAVWLEQAHDNIETHSTQAPQELRTLGHNTARA